MSRLICTLLIISYVMSTAILVLYTKVRLPNVAVVSTTAIDHKINMRTCTHVTKASPMEAKVVCVATLVETGH
jgi:low affinity Fe/Cu permease